VPNDVPYDENSNDGGGGGGDNDCGDAGWVLRCCTGLVHRQCIRQWIESHKTMEMQCPRCNESFTAPDYSRFVQNDLLTKDHLYTAAAAMGPLAIECTYMAFRSGLFEKLHVTDAMSDPSLIETALADFKLTGEDVDMLGDIIVQNPLLLAFASQLADDSNGNGDDNASTRAPVREEVD